MEGKMIIKVPWLGIGGDDHGHNTKTWNTKLLGLVLLSLTIAIAFICLALDGNSGPRVTLHYGKKIGETGGNTSDVVESEEAVVAADDGRCSEIGVSMLRKGGHAVDAAVATALCLGVVNPMASGIGGGAFMIVRSAATSQTLAFNFRETAPLAASQDMYENNTQGKFAGALAMGVPGELAGLHEVWSRYGRLPWKTLFQPAIKLAKNGFVVAPYLALCLSKEANKVTSDPSLQQVYAPNGTLLKAGDMCYNVELGKSLEEVAEKGIGAFYNGTVGEKLIKDIREAGGILTMEDLRSYKVDITDAVEVNAMGYTILGMPPPSSGTLGLALILNILSSYESSDAAEGALGLHRLIESLKHMFAIRMNLGDPNFENITETASRMLSPDYAKMIQQKIFDNTTFSSDYYLSRWSQLQDHGTSHFCIVDAERNAVSMTTTVNHVFGGGIQSPSTGILLNNEMDDFSTPTETSPDNLPPAPVNFIKPNKRPLSSMTPLVVLKDGQLVGVVGGSGGIRIIPAVVQVFVNHFLLGMNPSDAVKSPRVYHKLIPNVVRHDNLTVLNGLHIELSKDRIDFLEQRGHKLERNAKEPKGQAISQLVSQKFEKPVDIGRKCIGEAKDQVLKGLLTAVSDPRKDGKPAAV